MKAIGSKGEPRDTQVLSKGNQVRGVKLIIYVVLLMV